MRRSGIILGLAFLNVALIVVVAWQAQLLRGQKATLTRMESQASETAAAFVSSSSAVPESFAAGDGGFAGRSPVETYSSGASPVSGAATLVETNWPKFDWQQVESADYQTYVKNLRAIGCPEQTVRDIVAADVLQAFSARRAEVMAERYRDFEYWKADPEETAARADLETKRRAVDEAMGSALDDLLGADVVSPPTTVDWQRAALGQQLTFLPKDKLEQTRALLLHYADTDKQIRELAWGHRTPENHEERLRILETYEKKKEALHGLLTPEEFERVELTASWTADNLRRAMTKFQPTEEEFRMIFSEWRTQDENLAAIFAKGEPDPGNQHVFANIAKVLGPERYAEYRATWWK